MAFDCYLKIEGIEGESKDKNHIGWMEIMTLSHGILQKSSATASSAGGAGSERADFGDFVVTKQMDKASPKLVTACASGVHIDKIVLEICRATGEEKIPYTVYDLSNCIISSYATAGARNIPMETLSINFGKINVKYVQQRRDGGGPAGNIAGGWDLQRNCKV